MDSSEITQKIFDIAVGYAQKVDSPISFVNVEVSKECPLTDEDLWNHFNKLRWDSALASAELLIERVSEKQAKEGGFIVKVTSLSLFEEDDQMEEGEPLMLVENGIVA